MLAESCRAAFESIAAHRLRSFLTTLGIAIGVAAVVVVIALVQGLQAAIAEQFEGLGGDSLSVVSFTPVEEAMKGCVARLSAEDLDLIASRVHGIASIAPRLQSPLGRFPSVADGRRRRVCVLAENPVGEYVELAGEWLEVVIVMEPRGELFGINQDDCVRVPCRALRRTHGLNSGDPDDFRFQTPDRIAAAFAAIGGTVAAVLGGTVGVSLLVGGIGIMNIMLVSVSERTREIGICKALGATRRQILLQCLTEALALSAIGGALGLAGGYGLASGIAALVPDLPSVVVPLWAIALAVGFSAGVAVAFGMLPAAKAADLDPVDALRCE